MAGNIYMYTGGAELNLSSEISHCDIKTLSFIGSRTLGPTGTQNESSSATSVYKYIQTLDIVSQLLLPITTTYTTKLGNGVLI